MLTCYLHIGLHKTGSSAIQAALQGYDDGRTRYCRFATPNHSGPMTLLFGGDWTRFPPVRHQRIGEADLKRRLRKARKALRREFAAKDRNLVISGEGLTTNLDSREVKRLVVRLRKHYEVVRAVAYVRPTISWANSAFQQRVKGDGLAVFKPPLPRYRRRLAPWIKHLGRENVEVALYDRESLLGGDVIEDFCARIDVDVKAVRRNSTNESLSAEALAFLFCHNRFNGRRTGSQADALARRQLIQKLEAVGSGRFSFSGSAIKLAEANIGESSRSWVEKVAGFPLKDTVPTDAVVFDSEASLLKYSGDCVELLEPLVPKAALAAAPATGLERCAAFMKAIEDECYLGIAGRFLRAAGR